MPTITFSLTDEDVERIAKRLAAKLADALKEVVAASSTRAEPPKQEPNPPAEWLTSTDIQRMFQVSRATVWRWANEMGMPTRRVGGIVRFQAAQVMECFFSLGLNFGGYISGR
ncbi:MAG TPA: helix-turn-helix domain-containing protein [Terriglobales bacterium]